MTFRPSGPCPAKIMLLGEYPGEQEVLRGEPFVGSSGQELNNMLRDAGIMRSACFISNVIRVRPPANDIENFIASKKSAVTEHHVQVNGKFVMPVVRDGVELLKREIEMCRPNVILAFGNVALWALTGHWGVMSWRGSVLECTLDLNLDYRPKVVPVYHPAVIMRNWSWRQIAIHDLKRGKKESGFQEIIRPDYSFVIRPDFGQAHAVLTQLLDEAGRRQGSSTLKLSVDLETRAGHIACIGIAWSKREALCIPLMCVENPAGYWTEEEEFVLLGLVRRLLLHAAVEVVGQNFLYDMQYFWRWLLYLPNLRQDTMIAQHSMFSNMQKGLDFLSSMYCEYHAYWKDEGKEWDPKKHDEDSYWVYNCKDAVITYEVAEGEETARRALAPTWPQVHEVNNFQQRLAWAVLQSMNRGVRIDEKRRATFAMELMEEIAKREQWLIDVLGEPLNPKSPKQMATLFYHTLGQKAVLDRKTGSVTCNDEALRKVAEREPILRPLTRKIAELRSLGVFLSTFVNAPLDADRRMRCSFAVAGADTYRFKSSENAFGTGMNMQNIPKGGEEDGLELPNCRELFIPDPGKTMFDIDLSSADLRIVVWESDEPTFKAMLKEGLDPYTEIAKEFYHDPTITKKDPRRQTFKSFAHGTNYLGTAKGLAERLGLSVHEAEKTQKWYFGAFPKIKKWQDDLKDQVFKRRMVQNVFGYRCYFFDRIEGTIFNQAAAWIPQSTVACLINRAYVNLYENHKDIEVLIQVHDSLVGQYDSYLGGDAERRIIAAAEIPLPYPGDPLIIPVGIKTSDKSWGGCD